MFFQGVVAKMRKCGAMSIIPLRIMYYFPSATEAEVVFGVGGCLQGMAVNVLHIHTGKIYIPFEMWIKNSRDEDLTGMIGVPDVLQKAQDTMHVSGYISDELEEYADKLACGRPYTMSVSAYTGNGTDVMVEGLLFRPRNTVTLRAVLCMIG